MVHSRLELIKDWPILARAVGYCATLLACKCGVSTRQLERFFQAKMACSPHKWLRKSRMQRATELIQNQMSHKQIAAELGYKNAAHFSRDFKQYFGVTPSEYSLQASLVTSRMVDVAFRQ